MPAGPPPTMQHRVSILRWNARSEEVPASMISLQFARALNAGKFQSRTFPHGAFIPRRCQFTRGMQVAGDNAGTAHDTADVLARFFHILTQKSPGERRGFGSFGREADQ